MNPLPSMLAGLVTCEVHPSSPRYYYKIKAPFALLKNDFLVLMNFIENNFLKIMLLFDI